MPRLIDLGDVLAVINASMLNLEYTDENRAMQKAISMLPTVDAEPVVRCKDCKHNQLPPTSGNVDCELWYGMTDVYGYCHYGERREDE